MEQYPQVVLIISLTEEEMSGFTRHQEMIHYQKGNFYRSILPSNPSQSNGKTKLQPTMKTKVDILTDLNNKIKSMPNITENLISLQAKNVSTKKKLTEYKRISYKQNISQDALLREIAAQLTCLETLSQKL